MASIHEEMLDVINDGEIRITTDVGKENPKAAWTVNEKRRYQLNFIANTTLYNSLSSEMYAKIKGAKTVKEIWD